MIKLTKTLTHDEVKQIVEQRIAALRSMPDEARLDAPSIYIEDARIENFDFSRYACFYDDVFYGMKLNGVTLVDCNFSDVTLSNNSWKDVGTSYCTFSSIEHTLFTRCSLYLSRLRRCNILNTLFEDCELSECNLRFARINNEFGPSFSKCSIEGCDFSLASIESPDNLPFDERTMIDASTPGVRLVCPEEGSFTAYKAVYCDGKDYIAKLYIPATAKRSSATSRKCRCSEAQVIEFYDLRHNVANIDYATSRRTNNFVYVAGVQVSVDDFDENRWNECSTGIHFFMTFDEAVNYARQYA